MALIKCKECGKEISSDAKSCPHCGKPNQEAAITAKITKKITRKISPLQIGIIGTGVLVLIFVLVVVATAPPNGMTRYEYKQGIAALEILDQYLEGNLSANLAADRIDGIRSDIERESPDAYIVAWRLEFIVDHIENVDTFGSMIQSDREDLAEELGKD